VYDMQSAILGRRGELLDRQMPYDSAVTKVKQKQTKFAAVLASAAITYATRGGDFVGTAWLVGAVLLGLALMQYHSRRSLGYRRRRRVSASGAGHCGRPGQRPQARPGVHQDVRLLHPPRDRGRTRHVDHRDLDRGFM